MNQIFNNRAGNINGGPKQKDGEQQAPEGGLVFVLDGIEPIAVEKGQAHGNPDLRLVHHNQKDNHDARQFAFIHRNGLERADGDDSLAGLFKIAVSDLRDPTDHRHIRNHMNEDGKYSHAGRQADGGDGCFQGRRPDLKMGQQ